MTSKERLICALEGGKPDRLPVSVHQWQRHHLHKYLGGISERAAFEKFGLDAQVQYYPPIGHFLPRGADPSKWEHRIQLDSSDPNNIIAHAEVRTPEGTLTFKTVSDRKTIWASEYMVKNDEDIELIRKYMPVPEFKPKRVNNLYDRVGEAGIVRGLIWGEQGGCWQHACCLMDVSELILRCFDKPDWVHEFLNILLEKKLRFIESMKGAKFDLVETGGGASSSTIISPAIHEQFCLPYDKKLHDALHDLGFRVTYHTCGGTKGIEEMIVANGADASETLAPPSIGGNQEPWEFKEKVGDRIAMIGGVDQSSLLTEGTEKQIRDKVFELFEKVGNDGGYVCSMADHFFEAPPENIKIFADAARECVY